MSFIDRILGRAPPLPPFRHKFDVPAIAASGESVYDRENTLRHFRRYLPFTFMFVRNMSATKAKIRLNHDPNIELEVESKGESTSSTIWFEDFSVINTSDTTTINADEITIWVEKT